MRSFSYIWKVLWLYLCFVRSRSKLSSFYEVWVFCNKTTLDSSKRIITANVNLRMKPNSDRKSFASVSTIMQGKGNHSIKLDNILSSKSISLITDTWNKNKTVIESKIAFAYNKIVYWQKVLFLLPTGTARQGFVEEMKRLVNSWTYKSDLDY